MSSTPYFSIVIPTWNRAAELRHTLRTCLDQDFDPNGFEIIVSDNCSTDDIRSVIEELSPSRIRYRRTDQHLSMTDSWNFAISQARGKYVGILATDDGYFLDLLSRAHRVLEESRAEAMTFQGVQYHWPNSPFVTLRNRLIVSRYAFAEGLISGKELVADAVATLDYGRLPTGMNCFISRDLLERIRKTQAQVFASHNPDVYAAIRLGSAASAIYVSSQSVFVGGFSGSSNGATCATDIHAAKRFYESRRGEALFPGLIPTHPPSLSTSILDSMLKALSDSGVSDPFSYVDIETYARSCYRDAEHCPDESFRREIREATDGFLSQLRPALQRKLQRENAWRRLRATPVIAGLRRARDLTKQWTRPLRHAVFRRPKRHRETAGDRTYDCTVWDVDNVYDAAVRARELIASPRRAA